MNLAWTGLKVYILLIAMLVMLVAPNYFHCSPCYFSFLCLIYSSVQCEVHPLSWLKYHHLKIFQCIPVLVCTKFGHHLFNFGQTILYKQQHHTLLWLQGNPAFQLNGLFLSNWSSFLWRKTSPENILNNSHHGGGDISSLPLSLTSLI